MCTASWTSRKQSYRLYFNRDEQRSRPRAAPPRKRIIDGVQVVAPTDSLAGGSWIAVNDHGVSAFLLNNYAFCATSPQDKRFRSRGEIPLLAVAQRSFDKSLEAVRTLTYTDYRPFLIGLMGPENDCRICEWNGIEAKNRTLRIPMLTTSSFKTSEVESYREKRYEAMVLSSSSIDESDPHYDYHCDVENADRAFNPLMSRSDAETQCLSVISVSSEGIDFDYYERVSSVGQRCSISLIDRNK